MKYLNKSVVLLEEQRPTPRFRRGLLLLTILFISLIGTGCKKFVTIPPPQTQLVTANLFSNNAAATTAVIAIYMEMFDNFESYNISQINGLLSDEQQNYSTVLTQLQFYTNAMLATSPMTGSWSNAYNYIYQANSVIEALKGNGAISSVVARQLTGEALFIRAFWHFYLANSYGDVPLVLTTDYTVNAVAPRALKGAVYQQVILDLKQAQGLLNVDYVDVSDTTITLQRVRPNSSAATALLARVYLYAGDWKDAEVQSSAVINNTALYQLDSLNVVFLAGGNSEAIWQIATPQPSNVNTNDGNQYILLAAPSVNGMGSTALSAQLMAAFEPGDLRRQDWVDSIVEGSQVYYYPYKYKVYQNSTPTEFTMVLRLGEQYLIRAEAEAEQNELSQAIADLDLIRSRAGLPNIAPAIAGSQTQMLSAILHERQVELFTEWGHRWYDLVRTGAVSTVLGSPGGVCQYKGGTWSETDSLYPIPQSERNADHNLTQNPGY